jgi:hypothetical protein
MRRRESAFSESAQAFAAAGGSTTECKEGGAGSSQNRFNGRVTILGNIDRELVN